MFQLKAKSIRRKKYQEIGKPFNDERLIHSKVDSLDPNEYNEAMIIDTITNKCEHYFELRPKVKIKSYH